MQKLAIVITLGTLASGCGVATRAQTPIERPALEVPPAPPRVIDPAPAPEIARIEPVGDLPEPPSEPKPARRQPARENGTRDAQKPESKPAEPPAVTEPPAQTQPAAASPQPAPVLRPPATADTAAAERRIRDIVLRAETMLGSIDYQKLNDQRRIAYDQAKMSIEGAEAALKDLSFELAQQLAEKAEKLARELQGR